CMPPVRTSIRWPSVRASCCARSRQMPSTPKPSSPRRTLPKPAIRARTSALRHRLDAESQPDVTVLDRDGEDDQPLGSVEPVAAAQVVPATVPAAPKLRALQRAELQRKR